MFSVLNRDMEYDVETDQYVIRDKTDNLAAFGEPVFNEVPENISFKRSKLAPTSLKIKDSYLEIGDKFVTSILVTALPEVFTEGILCQYLGNPKLKLFMTTNRLKLNISQLLMRDLREKEEQASKSGDRVLLERIRSELQSQQDYINQIVRDRDVTHNVIITFAIYADSYQEMKEMKEDLIQNLSSGRFYVTSPKFKQEQTFKMMTPL